MLLRWAFWITLYSTHNEHLTWRLGSVKVKVSWLSCFQPLLLLKSFVSCLTSLFFQSYSTLGRIPKVNFWELLEQHFLQAGCRSCCPTNKVKALNDLLSTILRLISAIQHVITVTGSSVRWKQYRRETTHHGLEASAWSVCSLSHPSTSIVQYTILFGGIDLRPRTSITITFKRQQRSHGVDGKTACVYQKQYRINNNKTASSFCLTGHFFWSHSSSSGRDTKSELLEARLFTGHPTNSIKALNG